MTAAAIQARQLTLSRFEAAAGLAFACGPDEANAGRSRPVTSLATLVAMLSVAVVVAGTLAYAF